jgi:uncharacterized protein (TIGR02996 family)
MTEDIFLQTLQEKPNDDTTRLIYADWLEEQDDPASQTKARFLRVDCDLAALSENDSRQQKQLSKQRKKLAEHLEAAWLAVVSKVPIEKCSFAFECPLKWENLTQVEGSSTTRFCDQCKQNVFYCETIGEARSHAFRGHCVAVDVRLTRQTGDLDPPRMLMGIIRG